MLRTHRHAEGYWPFCLMRRLHRKTWGKTDCILLFPSHPSAFCVPVTWRVSFLCASDLASKCWRAAVHPWVSLRSEPGAIPLPKIPPGKQSHLQGCEPSSWFCVCNIVIVIITILIVVVAMILSNGSI